MEWFLWSNLSWGLSPKRREKGVLKSTREIWKCVTGVAEYIFRISGFPNLKCGFSFREKKKKKMLAWISSPDFYLSKGLNRTHEISSGIWIQMDEYVFPRLRPNVHALECAEARLSKKCLNVQYCFSIAHLTMQVTNSFAHHFIMLCSHEGKASLVMESCNVSL